MRGTTAHPPTDTLRLSAASICAMVAALMYSSFLLSYVVPTGRTIDFVSELERPGAPNAGWYRASDVLAGLLLILLARLMWPNRNGQRVIRCALAAVAVVGLSSVLDGVSSMDCEPSVQSACEIADNSVSGLLQQLLIGHTLSGLAGFAAAGLGAAWCARAAWQRALASGMRAGDAATVMMRLHIALAAAIGLCGLADVALLLLNADVGVVERVRIVVASVWIAVLPWTVHVCSSPVGIPDRYILAPARRNSFSSTARYGGKKYD